VKRALLAIAALLVLMRLPHGTLSAQDAPRPVVEVVASGEPGLLAAMAERIGSLQARFSIALRWSVVPAIDIREVVAPRAAGEAVLTRVWLDLSDSQRAMLFIANAGHDRFLVRVVPVGDGYGELTRESLATVVESAVDALLAGGQIGVDRSAALRELAAQTGSGPAAEAMEPEPDPATPQPGRASAASSTSASAASASRGPWLLATHYRADAIADGPSLRHGAQLALSYAADVGAPVDLLWMVSAQLAPSFALGDGGQRVREQGGGARLAVGAASRAAGLFGWQAALGAGVDLFRVEPAIADELGLDGAAPFVATIPVATLFASASLRPAAWLDIGLGIGVDADLAGHHFDLASGSARTPLITPWRCHPYALLGVGMPLGGSAQP